MTALHPHSAEPVMRPAVSVEQYSLPAASRPSSALRRVHGFKPSHTFPRFIEKHLVSHAPDLLPTIRATDTSGQSRQCDALASIVVVARDGLSAGRSAVPVKPWRSGSNSGGVLTRTSAYRPVAFTPSHLGFRSRLGRSHTQTDTEGNHVGGALHQRHGQAVQAETNTGGWELV